MPDEKKPDLSTPPAEGKIPQTKEELEAALGIQPVPPPQETVIEYKLSTGQVYKGKTEKEVIDALVHAQEEATKTIRDREAQLREAQKPPTETRPAGTEFDKAKFYETMSEDPVAAFQTLMGHVMGLDPAVAAEALRYTYQTAQAVDARLQNALFREAYPDAPYGDEFADTMIHRMQDKGRAWNSENLGASYLELVHEGKLKPVDASAGGPSTPADAPAPNPGRQSTGAPADLLSQLEGMSTSEMQTWLKKMGYL